MGYVVPHDFLFLYTKINLMARNIKLHFSVEARTPVIDMLTWTPVIDMLTSLEIMQHLSFCGVFYQLPSTDWCGEQFWKITCLLLKFPNSLLNLLRDHDVHGDNVARDILIQVLCPVSSYCSVLPFFLTWLLRLIFSLV